MNMIRKRWLLSSDSNKPIVVSICFCLRTNRTIHQLVYSAYSLYICDSSHYRRMCTTKNYVCTEKCTCPKGLVYVDGGSPCGDTCADYGKPCRIFTKAPVKGCYCPKGMVRLRNGKCVHPHDKRCKKEYNRCTTDNTSKVIPAKCTSPPSKSHQNTFQQFSILISISQSTAFISIHVEPCDCRINGFCQDANSKYCPKGKVFINGGDACYQTCADLGKPCAAATMLPAIGCYCPKGTADLNGRCVRIDSRECKKAFDPTTDRNYNVFKGANCP